ncbi:dut [Wigglesworthia glossinidia endosymbiont of Glossina brevipalpis]|uniref:Deoxyuridine 5'-triphosphate nucleotidohydrolase n=1 Tax=Wigglesworthia glossinidia brevipalpis TaxID=36870 RepID=DUT_WIGBR|nr:RecName: Full=Deoxyuridine 5'-triphosphate nucleotidohydrolase; Short=dUTPase; AltName: Full=dUTP pyrophosphatase [Wigglesworthia glossinidia endosymbiont of Glossina brevipalpis]BAC24547.1 dut [Wigglesworthia glossinidia endosymbiont of Glossina brevipalpis]
MKKKVNIRILDKRFGKEFFLPKYFTDGSSGMDLRACIDKEINLNPNETVLISTGVSIDISDQKISGLILPRSGLSHKYGIILSNTIGLIDSDYQGPIMISMLNRSNKNFLISIGDRIAQIIFVPLIQIEWNIVNKFVKITNRKDMGFGHSGKN